MLKTLRVLQAIVEIKTDFYDCSIPGISIEPLVI